MDSLLDKAVSLIVEDHNRLQLLLKRQESTPVGDFINRVLSWYEHNRKQELLWEMFNKSMDMNPVIFMRSLHSFVVNCLLDDSAFRIEWQKNYVDDNFNLVYENGEPKIIISSKEDLDSCPVVYWDNDGVQDVRLLMEAMDEAESREELRLTEFQDFLKKISAPTH